MTDNILVMPTEQEEIQLQIDESRAALVDKLERLEGKVAETVQAATASVTEATAAVVETVNNATASVSETVGNVNAAVQGTVENVRNAVSDSVASVKETFDLPEQVRKYPWQMFAGAIALGFVGGRYLQPDARSVTTANRRSDRNGFARSDSGERSLSDAGASFNGSGSLGERNGVPAEAGKAASGSQNFAAATSHWTDFVSDTFGPEIAKLRGLAIGASLGLVRDMITSSAPPALRAEIAEVVDGFTQKLGAHPIHGPVLSSADRPQGQ